MESTFLKADEERKAVMSGEGIHSPAGQSHLPDLGSSGLARRKELWKTKNRKCMKTWNAA